MASDSKNSMIDRNLSLADSAMKNKNYESVIKHCDEVLKIDPNNIRAMYNKGAALGYSATLDNDYLGEAIKYMKGAELNFLETINQKIVDRSLTGNDFETFSTKTINKDFFNIATNYYNLGKREYGTGSELLFIVGFGLMPIVALILNDEESRLKYAKKMIEIFKEIFIDENQNKNLIDKYPGEVNVYLSNLNHAERILHQNYSNYESIINNMDSLKAIDKMLSEKAEDYKSLVKTEEGSVLGGIISLIIIIWIIYSFLN